MNDLEILNQLADQRISYQQALRLIDRKRRQDILAAGGGRRFLGGCLTLRVHKEDKCGIALKIPLCLASFGVMVSSLLPKVRRSLKEQGINYTQIRSFLHFLQSREAGFSVLVDAADGSRVVIMNGDQPQENQR